MRSLEDRREDNCRFNFLCCVLFTVFVFCLVLACGLITVSFLRVQLESPSTSVEVGGNVPVLLNLSGFDPLMYDHVLVTGLTAGSNTTLLLGLCEDLSTISIPLRPKNLFFKNSTKSPLPFNYNGGDIPVYSAGGNGSFISFNISAELEAAGDNHNDSHQSCGAQLVNFNNLTSYMEFIDNQTTYQSFSLPSCIPVGPPGSPNTTSIMFSLHEPGFYRQAVFVNTTLSINSSVTGSLSFYNTSSLEPVFCNTVKCIIHISSLPSTQNPRVCVLVLSSEYTAVEFRALEYINSWNLQLAFAFVLVACLLLIMATFSILILTVIRKYHRTDVSYIQ